MFSVGPAAGSGPIDSYLWTFHEGPPSSLQNPNHLYTSAGSYTVTVSATGPGGTAGPILLTVNVYDPINADFSWLQGGPGPFDVQFTDTSTGAPRVAWSWTFGSSPTLGTSALQHPAFSFPGAASYQVTLVVTDGMGRQDTSVMTITVS
jgi:PKD repeat protein